MQIIRRSVERIDDPLVLGRAGRAALFREYGVTGIGFVQRGDDRLLGLPIDFGHEVVCGFLSNCEQVEVAGGAVDNVARAARGLHRGVQHRMHGFVPVGQEGNGHSCFLILEQRVF